MAAQYRDQSLLLKTILIGDSGVGKSNLMIRYICNNFETESPSTIGVEFLTKIHQIQGMEVKAQIWDTAGQERFRALARAVYHGAKGAMVIYDITSQTSFDNVRRWLDELIIHVPANTPIMLVGNKVDLAQQRQVPVEAGQRFAEEHDLLFLETSALDATNVAKAFDLLVWEMLKKIGIPLITLPSKKASLSEGHIVPFSILIPGEVAGHGVKACSCKV